MTADIPDSSPVYEQIGDLREAVAELQQENKRLRDRVGKAEAQLARIQSDSTDTDEGVYPPWADRYDKHVLDEVPVGGKASMAVLRRLYKEAGIRNKGTLRKRLKTLARRPEMERTESGAFRRVE